PETRTAQVRLELANTDARLKFGMFVDVRFVTTAAKQVVVPATAVQSIGGDTVVFVPASGSTRRFRERKVILGGRDGDRVAVMEGLSAGERIVTKGSFDLRAEAER